MAKANAKPGTLDIYRLWITGHLHSVIQLVLKDSKLLVQLTGVR
jgi:hypothetical protein